jgi:Ser/Thr protein kinase RdoA (MazF antagonist)
MNLWAFGPGVVDELRRSFEAFVAEHPVGAGSRDDTNGEIDPGTAELGLPVALGRLVGTDAIVARSVPTTSTWLGVTWPDDVSLVRGRLLAPVAAAFGRPVPRRAERLGHGHIHVTVAADDVVYQRLNTDVFADVGAVVANAGRIHDHLARLEPALPIAVPEPLSSTAGPLVWHDGDGEVWRAARRITGVESTLVARSPAEAFEAARAFGALTRALDDLDGEPLVETIAGFHDFAGRRAQMERAVEADREHRMAQAVDVVAEARVLAADVAGALVEAGVDDLSRRVVHNDAKIANVLFAAGRADSHPHAVAVVDLDTTWSATVLADLGELLRTGGTAAAEDEPDLSVVTLDERLLTAIVRGYLAGLDGLLTPAELDALDVAGAWLATENGLRFLTDHLDGDRYFGVSRTHHNLDRARAQLRLGRLLLDARTRLAALLHEDRP